jgi:hypothetical protein
MGAFYVGHSRAEAQLGAKQEIYDANLQKSERHVRSHRKNKYSVSVVLPKPFIRPIIKVFLLSETET